MLNCILVWLTGCDIQYRLHSCLQPNHCCATMYALSELGNVAKPLFISFLYNTYAAEAFVHEPCADPAVGRHRDESFSLVVP